jgi:hypothetical protein
MREKTRAREEHPEGDERRRANGRPREDEHGPPRRPAHYVAARPPKRPRGRVAKGFARLIGLLATGVLLAVGVTVVLMVTRDNGTEPPETFAQANPTPAPKKTASKPKKPKLTPAQRASRDAAVKQIRGQGFVPVSLADYKTGQSLRVLLGKPKKSTGVRGRRAFFFQRRDYLGTDAASPSLRVRVLRQRDGVITLGYRLYLSGDKPSDPSGELAKVHFTISDGRLIPQDQIPPAASRLPPS